MRPEQEAARRLLQQQIQRLDAIVAETTESLNTVRGTERLEQWKQETIPLLERSLGTSAAGQLASTYAGPSFTNDLFEEFTDRSDTYRHAVQTILTALK